MEAPTLAPEVRGWGLAGRPSLWLLILLVLPILIYSNTFSFPFIFDDSGGIVENLRIRDLGNFLDFSGTRYVGFLSFALNYRFGGLNVFGYHLVNLLIHITNGFLVYFLVLLLFRATQSSQSPPPSPSPLAGEGRVGGVALATALLFVAHPIQTQAVTYIVQRFASLVALFYLLSVVCYLKWRLHHISPHPPLKLRGGARGSYVVWYLASLVSCLLAMKTKENSFTLPFMILLIEMTFFRPITRRGWFTLIPFLLMLPVVPFARGDILGESERFLRDVTPVSRLEYLFTQFRVIVTYLRLLVLPVNQNLDYEYPIYDSLSDPPVFLSFLFLSSLLGFALWGLFRPQGPRLRFFSFGILWFFLALSVESSIVPIMDMIFEHRLYLPSVGFLMAVSVVLLGRAGLWANARQNGLLVTGIGLVILVLGWGTYQRNFVWADAETLWRDVVNKAPGKARGHFNLGFAYQETGKIAEAIQEYQKVIPLRPDYPDLYNNLGNLYKKQRRFDEGIQAFEKAIDLKPDFAEAYNNLGSLYEAQGRLEEAIQPYRKALEIKPNYAEPHNNLGIVYMNQGRLEEAIPKFELAASLKPDSPNMHYDLGVAYHRGGRLEEAIQEYQTALNLKPDYVEARQNLGTAYASQGRFQEAVRELEEVLKRMPNQAQAHNNLGNVYMNLGRFEEAVGQYQKALQLKPDSAQAKRNLDYVMEQLGHSQ